jgi:hypothetical protein
MVYIVPENMVLVVLKYDHKTKVTDFDVYNAGTEVPEAELRGHQTRQVGHLGTFKSTRGPGNNRKSFFIKNTNGEAQVTEDTSPYFNPM